MKMLHPDVHLFFAYKNNKKETYVNFSIAVYSLSVFILSVWISHSKLKDLLVVGFSAFSREE